MRTCTYDRHKTKTCPDHLLGLLPLQDRAVQRLELGHGGADPCNLLSVRLCRVGVSGYIVCTLPNTYIYTKQIVRTVHESPAPGEGAGDGRQVVGDGRRLATAEEELLVSSMCMYVCIIEWSYDERPYTYNAYVYIMTRLLHPPQVLAVGLDEPHVLALQLLLSLFLKHMGVCICMIVVRSWIGSMDVYSYKMDA